MTTITPDHNSGICHAASENRRRVLEKLRELAYQLENCDKEPENTAGGFRSEDFDENDDDGGEEDDCFYICSTQPPCKAQERGSRTRRNGLAMPDGGKQGCRNSDGGRQALQQQYNRMDQKDYTKNGCPPQRKSPQNPPELIKFGLERTKSRALIGGVLVNGCDCVRRNGLQDSCKRFECQGRPECMTRPEPTCGPSMGSKYVTYEDTEAKKEIPKPYLRVCCRCPPDCYEKKQNEDYNPCAY